MKYCDQCGKKILREAQFCRYCGQKVFFEKNMHDAEGRDKKLDNMVESTSDGKMNNEIKNTLPRPWIRLWARYIDISIFGLLGGFLISLIYDVKSGPFFGITLTGYGIIVLSVIVLESICLTLFGGTPGKWLANIRIADFEGKRPSIKQSLDRTFLVWEKGMWFGVPILFFIPMYLAKKKLDNNGSTSWDIICRLTVYHRPVSAIRYVGIVVAIVALMILNSYLKGISNQPTQKHNPKVKVAIEYQTSYDTRLNRGSVII